MRILHCLSIAVTALLLAGCAANVSKPAPEARNALAPSGTLRGAVLLNTALQVSRTGASGELQGVAIDLGRELARRLGVGYTPVAYQSIEQLMAGAKSAQWDIAFMAVDLPAPLRPSSATTSPARASNDTPCRIWARP